MCLLIRITILLIFVCSVFFASGQELFGEEMQDRLDIAKTAMARLEEKTTKKKTISVVSFDPEMEKVNSLYMKWKEEPSDSSWRALMSEITSVSTRREVGSHVTIKTLKDNKPQVGATIRYRLTDCEDIKTAKSPTTATEYFVPIGYYYIWSERQGRETSDRKSQYSIIKQNEEVTINEYK